jgi:lipoprotein-anchoring transpeptidase ErfK/SrfK
MVFSQIRLVADAVFYFLRWLHGSYEIARLGRPASHGCIRLHPQNAAILFALIKEHMGETSIVVTGQALAPSGGKWQWQY